MTDSEPIYTWRVVFKTRDPSEAIEEIGVRRSQHPERNYKIIVLDGSPDFRIVYLRVVE